LYKGDCSRWRGEIIEDPDGTVEISLIEIIDFNHFWYVEYVEWLRELASQTEMYEMESGMG